jgi:hypothetical protein
MTQPPAEVIFHGQGCVARDAPWIPGLALLARNDETAPYQAVVKMFGVLATESE